MLFERFLLKCWLLVYVFNIRKDYGLSKVLSSDYCLRKCLSKDYALRKGGFGGGVRADYG